MFVLNNQLYGQFPHSVQPFGIPFDPEAYKRQKEEDMLMPLQGVRCLITTQNSIVKSKLHLTYLNESDNKIEALLELPNNPDLVISKLKVKVGDTEIRAQVQEKQKARERYEDAVAAGH